MPNYSLARLATLADVRVYLSIFCIILTPEFDAYKLVRVPDAVAIDAFRQLEAGVDVVGERPDNGAG